MLSHDKNMMDVFISIVSTNIQIDSEPAGGTESQFI